MSLFSTRALVGVLVVFVALAVTRGIMIIGLPSEERTRQIDERRVQDLQRMSRGVDVFYTRHQRLPPSLGELAVEPGLTFATSDGETGVPYDYRVIDAERYQVCASFANEGVDAGFWSHGAGEQCFTLKAKQTTPE